VYVDESGINTFLQREYARAPRGNLVRDVKRGQKFERVNVIGALCNREYFGIECYRHTTDSAFFESWFEERLLGELPKGYTIIMDNAKFHRKKKLRKLARGKARLLFLPPYSPDYNPIEKSWANMKRFLCNNLRDFKSVDSAIYDYFGVLDI
jgi:transposase